ncbi:DUF4278 domain-containing protein [Pantanalinema rosaneae CENA516]|uniref:DUF4278 domain-containing protein n=1 Tax=Pantanalinema rosaneae TaxID=1620701 RepID=UPI003D6DF986
MSLLRLTLVAVLSLAAIALPLIGLFKAPWYILLLVLTAGFAVTQLAIVPPTPIAQSSSGGTVEPEPPSTHSELPPDRLLSPTEPTTQLTYRGANYQPISPLTEAEEPTSETLSGKYRGCDWNHPANSNHQMVELSVSDRPTVVRKYRGVKISQN